MTSLVVVYGWLKSRCLTNEDFYALLAGSRGRRALAELEHHLTRCAFRRDRLSGLREVLEPDAQEIREAFPELTPREIEEMLGLIARSYTVPGASARWSCR